MSDDISKRRLGRGLAALIGEMDQPLPVGDARPVVNPDRLVPIEFIVRNPKNPRRYFDESELQDLASSIRQHGIVQPVVARPIADGKFEIIAGERRWRACRPDAKKSWRLSLGLSATTHYVFWPCIAMHAL